MMVNTIYVSKGKTKWLILVFVWVLINIIRWDFFLKLGQNGVVCWRIKELKQNENATKNTKGRDENSNNC